MQRRGVDYERAITEDYLHAARRNATARFFHHYDAAPVLIVNTDHLNFVDNAGRSRSIVRAVAAMRGAREFFNLVNQES